MGGGGGASDAALAACILPVYGAVPARNNCDLSSSTQCACGVHPGEAFTLRRLSSPQTSHRLQQVYHKNVRNARSLPNSRRCRAAGSCSSIACAYVAAAPAPAGELSAHFPVQQPSCTPAAAAVCRASGGGKAAAAGAARGSLRRQHERGRHRADGLRGSPCLLQRWVRRAGAGPWGDRHADDAWGEGWRAEQSNSGAEAAR